MPVRRRRSTLFVGALVLDGLGAALKSGADLVCVDLEDAVPPGRKDEARDALVAALDGIEVPAAVQLVARVNTVGSPEGDGDVRALAANAAIGALMLPKAESADGVRRAARMLNSVHSKAELYAIIETAQGLEECVAVARSDPRLAALFFGGFDLSTSLGCAMEWEPLLYARSRVLHAGALAGLDVIDSPFPDVNDLAGLAEACRRVKALGMAGKCAKHATQVATIRDAFTPAEGEIARARKIVALFREDPTRPLVFEGKLVELPAIKKLERLLAVEG